MTDIVERLRAALIMERLREGGIAMPLTDKDGYTVQDPHGFVVVRHALAILRCEVFGVHGAGDHDLVVGEVVDFEGSGGQPLIFHRGAFGGLDADALVPQGRVIGIHTASGW